MLTRVRRLTTPLAVTLLAGGTALGTVAVASSAAADQGGVPAIPLNTEQETTGSNTGASGFFSYTHRGRPALLHAHRPRPVGTRHRGAHPRRAATRRRPGRNPLDWSARRTTSRLRLCHVDGTALLADLQANPEGVLRQRPHAGSSPAERSAASSSDLTRIPAYPPPHRPPPHAERPTSVAMSAVPERPKLASRRSEWAAGRPRSVGVGVGVRASARRRCAWNRSDA